MQRLDFCSHVLGFGIAAAAFAGCGGSQQPLISAAPPIGATQSANARSDIAPRHHHSKTFSYTGAQQNFMVPTGVTSATVKAYGGSSGSGLGGGYVKATIPVTSGESLAIFVGGNPNGATGGFNGGGNGGGSRGGGGGGASDVRQGGKALANRVIVAGGGGGAGVSFNNCQGGAGGAGAVWSAAMAPRAVAAAARAEMVAGRARAAPAAGGEWDAASTASKAGVKAGCSASVARVVPVAVVGSPAGAAAAATTAAAAAAPTSTSGRKTLAAGAAPVRHISKPARGTSPISKAEALEA